LQFCSASTCAGAKPLPSPTLILIIVITMTLASAVSWFVTWRDKRSSEIGRARVPERTLHTLELLGGWPGSFLARRRFRHKTRKWSFRIVSALCTLAHVSIVAVIFWRWGW